jgi:hypothetical protein
MLGVTSSQWTGRTHDHKRSCFCSSIRERGKGNFPSLLSLPQSCRCRQVTGRDALPLLEKGALAHTPWVLLLSNRLAFLLVLFLYHRRWLDLWAPKRFQFLEKEHVSHNPQVLLHRFRAGKIATAPSIYLKIAHSLGKVQLVKKST